MYYGDHYIPGQIIEEANVPTDIDNYERGPEEVKIFRTEYGLSTSEYQDLYKTLSLIIIRGDDNDTFFNYGCEREKFLLF